MRICTSCGHESEESFRFCPACGSALASDGPRREQRKRVTVLFCDVTDSTALGETVDPEALRAVLARYFNRMKTIVERHGGSVEKFIGDAVMAVFGVPTVHEDDAVRALRAAVEMRDVFPELGLRGRIGVDSGEIVTGTAERLATGDAVNVASRLQQAAAPGEVLIGAATLELARNAVDVQRLEPLRLKGKAKPVLAYRLVSVSPDAAVARALDAPLVGRTEELNLLGQAWQRSVSERSCQLFTLLGAAGVGKSRLVAEFLSTVADSTVVHGRCLSYGEGITYWPVVSILKQLLPDEPAARLQLYGLEPTMTAPLLDLLQEEGGHPAPPLETAWALRKLLEAEASRQPVICLLDDLHWGEPALLDLVEHVADLSRDAPLLLLCLARPELLERRPGWAGGKLNAITALLEPLATVQIETLISNLLAGASLAPELHDRVLVSADGNPLFVEEMLALVRDSPDGEVEVPATVQALLVARIDQLGFDERTILEGGSVEGNVFHRGAVAALVPDQGDVDGRLLGLVRKELLRPDRAQITGDNAFRFRHILIRDAAYDGLPKAVRADLHERFARWLESHGEDLVELDELLGYHLEQAFRYRAELGEGGERVSALAAAAGRRLESAGVRAYGRYDLSAAVTLLRRALELLPVEERTFGLVRVFARSLLWAALDDEADALLRSELQRSKAIGDDSRATRVELFIHGRASVTTPGVDYEALRVEAERAITTFEAAGDSEALAEAIEELMWVELVACRQATVLDLVDRVRLVTPGPHALSRELEDRELAAHSYGPTPAQEVLAFAERRAYPNPDDGAWSLALMGDVAKARELLAAQKALLRDRGARVGEATSSQEMFEVEMLAGDAVAAEREARAGCELVLELGRPAFLCLQAPQLALALLALGRDDEAEHWLRVGEEALSSGDVIAEIHIDRVRARLATRRGDHATAAGRGRAAVDRAEQTDMLYWQGEVWSEYADILLEVGRGDDAVGALRVALDRYERKGVVVRIAQTKARLASLDVAVAP